MPKEENGHCPVIALLVKNYIPSVSLKNVGVTPGFSAAAVILSLTTSKCPMQPSIIQPHLKK